MSKTKGKAAGKPVPTPMQMAVAKVDRHRGVFSEAMKLLDQAQTSVVRAHHNLQEAEAEKMKLALAEMQASTAGLNS